MKHTAYAHCRFDMLSRAAWSLYQDGLFAQASLLLPDAHESAQAGLACIARAETFAKEREEKSQCERTRGDLEALERVTRDASGLITT